MSDANAGFISYHTNRNSNERGWYRVSHEPHLGNSLHSGSVCNPTCHVLYGSHFDRLSVHTKQVPAYDRSAFMATVTGAAAKVSHLDRWFLSIEGNSCKSNSLTPVWLLQATSNVSHKVLTVTTRAENSKEPTMPVRTGCLRSLSWQEQVRFTSESMGALLAYLERSSNTSCILLMRPQSSWMNP